MLGSERSWGVPNKIREVQNRFCKLPVLRNRSGVDFDWFMVESPSLPHQCYTFTNFISLKKKTFFFTFYWSFRMKSFWRLDQSWDAEKLLAGVYLTKRNPWSSILNCWGRLLLVRPAIAALGPIPCQPWECIIVFMLGLCAARSSRAV